MEQIESATLPGGISRFAERCRYPIVIVGWLAVSLVFRSLWSWGDWQQIIVQLEEDAPENLRWLNGIVILNQIYSLLRPCIGARAFLTYSGIVLGAIAQPFLLNIIERSLRSPLMKHKYLLHAWISSAFGTWTLFSGYVEIYPFVQFSIIMFLWAFLLPGSSRIIDALAGSILGFAPSVYIGLLPLYPLGLLSGKRSRLFLIFWFAGMLGAALLLTSNWGFSLQSFLGLFTFHHAGPLSWYVGIFEMFNPLHVRNIIRSILFYDPLLPLIGIVTILNYRTYKNDIRFAILLGYSVFFFVAFTFKRHVLGFADWDVFIWAVIFWNVSMLPSVSRIIGLRILAFRIIILLGVWFVFNKPSQHFDLLPVEARFNALNNRHPMRSIPDIGSMSDIRQQLIDAREKRSVRDRP